MGSTTKIDWADATWNPITGCLHGCKYCYARRIAERFRGAEYYHSHDVFFDAEHTKPKTHELDNPAKFVGGTIASYPFGFEPTFHHYKLDEPQRWKKPRTIFVCSMADLFGEWVPDEWIKAVFDACAAAPQHRYLFLTKNPKRYMEQDNWLPKHARPSKAFEMWLGYTYDGIADGDVRKALKRRVAFHQFISIEPLLAPIRDNEICAIQCTCDWVIIGAETGNSKRRVIPDKGWIMEIADACYKSAIPVFMKDSLREIMGDDFRQEFPWEES